MKDSIERWLKELEPLSSQHQDLMERYTTGSDNVSLKQIDQTFRKMKPLMKQLRAAARSDHD